MALRLRSRRDGEHRWDSRAMFVAVIMGVVGVVVFGVGAGGGAAQLWDEMPWLAFLGLGICLIAVCVFAAAYQAAGRRARRAVDEEWQTTQVP